MSARIHSLTAALCTPRRLMKGSGLPPDPWQSDLMASPGHRELVLCSRQSGKTESVAAIALSRCLLRRRHTALVLAPTLRQSGETITRAKALLAEARPVARLTSNAATKLAFSNGSRLVALPGVPATIRGLPVNTLVMDEAAFLHDDVYDAAFPMTAATSGDIILMTTANGQQGRFYELWERGGDRWRRTRIPWHKIPRISPDFIAEQRAAMSAARFASEYECKFTAHSQAVIDPAWIERAMAEPDANDGVNRDALDDLAASFAAMAEAEKGAEAA